ncbi:MAG TPA: hypothetical protein VG276_29875 [Actinomycetes bacterium]|nr:hypothetical protein [Actinomycetes bacterium]
MHQCPDPERLLALAGMVRTLEHNWELDYYGPRGFAKARMGERPRIDPEAVRQAQPGEAWVIQAGHAIHLRVLPPPAVAPEPAEPATTVPLSDDTVPCRWTSRRRSGSRRPSLLPAGRPAASAGASVGGGSGPGGCLHRPGGHGWSGGRCQGGDGDEVTGGDRWRRCAPVRAGPCTHADLRAGPHPGPASPPICWQDGGASPARGGRGAAAPPAATQQRCERRASRRVCPVCHQEGV